MSSTPWTNPGLGPEAGTTKPTRSRRRLAYAGLVVVGLLLSMLPATSAGAAVRQATAPPPVNWATNPVTPTPGLLVNDPMRPARQQVILKRIIDTIDSVPPGGIIRISDWNIQSPWFTRHAIWAHHRGVSVQILMSGGVASRQGKRGSFWTLQRDLGTYNPRRPGSYSWSDPATGKVDQSFATTCGASCRGIGGMMHAKVVMVSQAGQAQNVVMVSSANMTQIAGSVQWNDLFTAPGNSDLYNWFTSVFDAQVKDRPTNPRYLSYHTPTLPGYWSYSNPHFARDVDPVMWELNRVRCRNAGWVGIRGRTVIRIAQTAIAGSRGLPIANRLATLNRQGCNIRVVFTLAGAQQANIMRRAGIPLRQLTRDTNHDGYYDHYLHTKLLTINGNIGGRPNQRLVRNGSENWVPNSFFSDEAGFEITVPGVVLSYTGYINQLFSIGSTTVIPQNPNARTSIDPWKYVEIE